jgi:toxin ParE1/3/4
MARRRSTLIWSPEARGDLSDIWDYYAKNAGRDRADNRVREISDAARLLETHPFAGRARDEIRPGLRSISVRPYVVFYRIRDDIAEIVRILHGRRDLPEVFTDDTSGK